MRRAARAAWAAGVLAIGACATGSTAEDDGALPPAPSGGTMSAEAGVDTAAPPSPGPDADGADSTESTHDSAAVDVAPADAPADVPVSTACAKTFDFEADDGAFTHDATDGESGTRFDAWAYGAATGGAKCHSGTKCFATHLSGDYSQCERAELRSPVLDLSTCAGVTSIKLAFYHALDFLEYTDAIGTAYSDGGLVELSGDGGSTWRAASLPSASVGNIHIAATRGFIGEYTCPGSSTFHVDGQSGFVGKGSGWQKVEIDVPKDLWTSKFMVRLAYATGKSTADTAYTATATGWHVDDVAVVTQ